jgi:hypothetical protein
VRSATTHRRDSLRGSSAPALSSLVVGALRAISFLVFGSRIELGRSSQLRDDRSPRFDPRQND